MSLSNFTIQLRTLSGEKLRISTSDAASVEQIENGAVYKGFNTNIVVTATAVPVSVTETQWGISVENNSELAVEWIDYPNIPLGKLKRNGGDAELLLSYNEGVIVEDAFARDTSSPFKQQEIEYPSQGSFYMFPHMLSAQFIAYLSKSGSVYLGAHDPSRAPKSIDYNATEDGVTLFVKTFTGAEYGESVTVDYPIVTHSFNGGWEDAATIYRNWFEANLPSGSVKIKDNKKLRSEIRS